MINGARVKALLELRGKSQAALARTIGVSPQAVSKIVNGETADSPKLYQIARFLRTTPEYITSETDVSESDIAEVSLTSEECELLDLFRGLERNERGAFITLARSIATSARIPTVQSMQQEDREDPVDARLRSQPKKRTLEWALEKALQGTVPRRPEARARYLASVVQQLLELPEDLAANRDSAATSDTVVQRESDPIPRTKKQAEQS